MSETKTSYNVGIGFGEALTLLFITLKLTGVIQWSWWWVLSPIWLGLSIIFILAIIYAILVNL